MPSEPAYSTNDVGEDSWINIQRIGYPLDAILGEPSQFLHVYENIYEQLNTEEIDEAEKTDIEWAQIQLYEKYREALPELIAETCV